MAAASGNAGALIGDGGAGGAGGRGYNGTNAVNPTQPTDTAEAGTDIGYGNGIFGPAVNGGRGDDGAPDQSGGAGGTSPTTTDSSQSEATPATAATADSDRRAPAAAPEVRATTDQSATTVTLPAASWGRLSKLWCPQPK